MLHHRSCYTFRHTVGEVDTIGRFTTVTTGSVKPPSVFPLILPKGLGQGRGQSGELDKHLSVAVP